MDSYFANEARSIPSSSCHGIVQEIHVLLVDHDSDSLMNTTKMLEMCSYRVTVAISASAAISTLSSGKAKFDIVVADVNSPDFRAFELLYHAINMGLPVIFMSAEDDKYLAMRALENGALQFFKKPATMEILHCLWQHVYREREQNRRNKERVQEMAAEKRGRRSGMDDKNPDHTLGGKGKAREKFEGRKGDEDRRYRIGDCNLVIGDNSNKGVKRKVCIDWNDELHAKFVDAVAQLGEGRCFPKGIVRLMDVPHLKRMQVASHLQKCRNNNQQAPGERRPLDPVFHNLSKSQYKPRKFGSMPQLVQTQASPQSAQDPVRRNFPSIAPQGSRAQEQTSGPVPSPCQHDQAYHLAQNSPTASTDSSSKGQWSSDTSDVESDGSETKTNIKSE